MQQIMALWPSNATGFFSLAIRLIYFLGFIVACLVTRDSIKLKIPFIRLQNYDPGTTPSSWFVLNFALPFISLPYYFHRRAALIKVRQNWGKEEPRSRSSRSRSRSRLR